MLFEILCFIFNGFYVFGRALISAIVMVLATIATLFIGIVLLFPGNQPPPDANPESLLVGFFIASVATVLFTLSKRFYRKSNRPKVFDRLTGYYYEGQAVKKINDLPDDTEHHPLEKINAIQILDKGKGFEINLVLEVRKPNPLVYHDQL